MKVDSSSCCNKNAENAVHFLYNLDALNDLSNALCDKGGMLPNFLRKNWLLGLMFLNHLFGAAPKRLGVRIDVSDFFERGEVLPFFEKPDERSMFSLGEDAVRLLLSDEKILGSRIFVHPSPGAKG